MNWTKGEGMNRVKQFFKWIHTVLTKERSSKDSRQMVEPSRLMTALWITAAALLGACFVYQVFFLFQQICPDEKTATGLCKIMYQHPPWTLITAFATLPAVLLTWYWRTFHKRAEIRTSQEGQITERFIKAVTLLGKDSAEEKLGAIYALERIAKDSRDDHWTVMETLAAFIRQRAPYPPPEDESDDDDSEKKAECPPVSAELHNRIQAALTVLGRRRTDVEEKDRIDLTRTNLQGMRIEDNFAWAVFIEANLKGAKLYEANLQEAFLREADLQEANLNGANLQGAFLNFANLQEANLGRANLQKAKLYGANLQGAYLRRANLQGEYLSKANLQGARLEGADLQGAYLIDANLQEAYLIDANLQGAQFVGADLQGAYLNGADLQEAKYSKETIFPDGFDPEEHGMILVDNRGRLIHEEPSPDEPAPEPEDDE